MANSRRLGSTARRDRDEYRRSEYEDKKPNLELLEHDRKRRIEVKCVELQDELEELGFAELSVSVGPETGLCRHSAEEIENQVSALRVRLLAEHEQEQAISRCVGPLPCGNSHLVAALATRTRWRPPTSARTRLRTRRSRYRATTSPVRRFAAAAGDVTEFRSGVRQRVPGGEAAA